MRTINNTFTKGELDPTLYARSDTDIYAKGARKMRNMISLWTGAARIAPGATYTDVIVDRENSNAPITDANFVNGIDFLYDAKDEVVYTIILRQSNAISAIDIYYNDALQATLVSTVAPNPPITYTPAQIKEVRFLEGHDRVLLLHENVQIGQLVRDKAVDPSLAVWTFSLFEPSVYPTFDYSVVGEATDYRVAAFVFTLSAKTGSGIGLTTSSAVFTKNHEGGLFRSSAGVARIVTVTNATTAVVNILEVFLIVAHDGVDSSLTERMWGLVAGTPTATDRGWPARGTYFLNRLILGRSPMIKNVCVLSTSGVYNNFNDSDIDALSAFSVSFNGRGDQSVQSIIADDSIIFLTSNLVFAQNPLVEAPISATSFYFAPQSQNASSGIDAVSIDNQMLYPSANASQVIQLAYSTGDAKYMGFPAGMLSNHLFETINSNATWLPKNVEAKLYLATQENGTMLMYNTLIQQGVTAWSLRDTRGFFRRVLGNARQAHVITERQINLGTSTFESSMDYVYLSDSTFTAYYNVTDEFSDNTINTSVLESQYDYILLGDDIPFTSIDWTFSTLSSHDCAITIEYLDGNGFWDVFTPTDDTVGFTVSDKIYWTFDDVLNWQPNNVNGIEQKFWVRIRRTTETVTTTPIVQELDVNTGNRIYLEKLNFNKYMDSTVTTSSNASGDVTGLTNLAGHQVYAIVDGATMGPYFVNDAGATNITNEYSSVDLGIAFKPLLIPMPLNTPTQEGDNTYAQKYVQDLYIDYVDSLYLTAGADELMTGVPIIELGNYTLGKALAPKTGVYTIHPRGDWSPRQELTITQSQPGPMTIIGVGYHVRIT